MIQSHTLSHELSETVFSHSMRKKIEADILSYGCDTEVVDEVCERAMNNEFIDILDILEDTEMIDMYQAAELVKTWFGEKSIFTSYHVYLNEARKARVREGLHELGLMDKDFQVFNLLRKGEMVKLYNYIKRRIENYVGEDVREMILSWAGDAAYKPMGW